MTLLEQRPQARADSRAVGAWVTVGLIPVGWVVAVGSAFLSEGAPWNFNLLPVLLVVAAPTGAVILGVVAGRAGRRSGWTAAVVAGLVLVVTFVFLAINVTDLGWTAWIIALVMVVAPLGLLGWHMRAAPLPPGAAGPGALRHRAVRYWVAGLLGIAGFIAALIWTGAAASGFTHYTDGLLRTTIPGQFTLHASHPGTYYIYPEGSLNRAAVRVTGPAGHAAPVTATTGGGSYNWGGMLNIRAIGEFNATRTGTYRVTAIRGDGRFLVSDGIANWLRPHEWGITALLVITVGASFLVLAAAIRRPPHNDAGASTPA